jgi:hypothetical protein
MPLEGLQTASDTVPTWLPAVAREYTPLSSLRGVDYPTRTDTTPAPVAGTKNLGVLLGQDRSPSAAPATRNRAG